MQNFFSLFSSDQSLSALISGVAPLDAIIGGSGISILGGGGGVLVPTAPKPPVPNPPPGPPASGPPSNYPAIPPAVPTPPVPAPPTNYPAIPAIPPAVSTPPAPAPPSKPPVPAPPGPPPPAPIPPPKPPAVAPPVNLSDPLHAEKGILISGCQSSETSADVRPAGGKAYGAFTNSLVSVVKAHVTKESKMKELSYRNLVWAIRESMIKSKFSQSPCLECDPSWADTPIFLHPVQFQA